jgi:hypothetical protein
MVEMTTYVYHHHFRRIPMEQKASTIVIGGKNMDKKSER